MAEQEQNRSEPATPFKLAEARKQGQVARSLFFRVVNRLPAPLNAEQPLIFRKRDRSFGFRPRYVARIARQTRPEADKVCAQIRAAGGACPVFKN